MSVKSNVKCKKLVFVRFEKKRKTNSGKIPSGISDLTSKGLKNDE